MKDLQKYKADFDNQNIILIGPSGVGKTEWQRALSQGVLDLQELRWMKKLEITQ